MANPQYWEPKCPHCQLYCSILKEQGVHAYACHRCGGAFVLNHDTGKLLPGAFYSGTNIQLFCPECNTVNRFPAGKRIKALTCGKCGHRISIDGEGEQLEPWDDEYYNPGEPVAPGTAIKRTVPLSGNVPPQEASAQPEAGQEPGDVHQGGFFSGVKSFFQERKENAEDECAMITDNPLTNYIGETIFNTLNDMRPQLAGCGPRDHFCLQVNRRDCVLYFYDYDSENRLHQHHILRCTYKQINDLFGWDAYEEIRSREARKWFVDVIYHEHIVRTGFLLRPRNESKRFGILRSQL